MSFMVSEEATVKEGGPRMIVTGYPAVWLSVVGMTVTGVKREAFHETDLVREESFCGRSLKGIINTGRITSGPACPNACNE